MTTPKFASVPLTIVLAFAGLQTGESAIAAGITTDPNTGDYIVNYTIADTGEARRFVFVPATKIAPKITASVRASGSSIVYQYTVFNGGTAKQAIIAFGFSSPTKWTLWDPAAEEAKLDEGEKEGPDAAGKAMDDLGRLEVTTDRTYTSAPPGWHQTGMYQKDNFGFSWGPLLSLDESRWKTIPRNASVSGFTLSLPYLPGIVKGGARGYVKSELDFPSEDIAEDEIREKMSKLFTNDFVPFETAGPMIPIPAIFDGAALVNGIKAELNRWPAMQQVSARFAEQEGRNLDALASALARQNIQGAVALSDQILLDIRSVRPDIVGGSDPRKTTPAPKYEITMLAAQVLAFDVAEVMRRARDVTKRTQRP